MVTKLKTDHKNLYNTDYNLWVLETVKRLENRDLDSLDWENLIEEVLDLSKRDKRKLKSLLKRLLEHLLKLEYWDEEKERNQNHWKAEIVNFRQLIRDQLEDSPSLKSYLLKIYPECYQDAKEVFSQRSQGFVNNLPDEPIVTLEQILDKNWLPDL